jgi:hypothetical protein
VCNINHDKGELRLNIPQRSFLVVRPQMLNYLVVLVSFVVTVWSEFLVLERRDSPPPGFSLIGPAPDDQILGLRLALTQGNIFGLQDTVYEISTPGNPRYGQYLTQDEVCLRPHLRICRLIMLFRSTTSSDRLRSHSLKSTLGSHPVISLHRPSLRLATGSQ